MSSLTLLSQLAILLILITLAQPCQAAFSIPRNRLQTTTYTTSSSNKCNRILRGATSDDDSSSSNNNEPDLFDYFDPLRSPHDYPNGIRPDQKPQQQQRSSRKDRGEGGPKQPFGLDLFRSELPMMTDDTVEQQQQQNEIPKNKFDGGNDYQSSTSNNNEPDLFDYFDPLRSPHDYPNGIQPDQKLQQQQRTASSRNDQGEGGPKQPFGLDLFRSEFPTAFATPPAMMTDNNNVEQQPPKEGRPPNKFKSAKKDSDNDQEEEELDLFDVFDPTLSPHSYPNGIPSTTVKKKQLRRVGIVLMDHGSRNEASNQRLRDMARLYQNTFLLEQQQQRDHNNNNGAVVVVVKAAHMEIASPSIPEVLESMVNNDNNEEGDGGGLDLDEIVCHPYFLSPGRHVKEDIPRIVEAAIEDLGITIPVITTSPLGSCTDLMIRAIHSLVEESSMALNNKQHDQRMGF